MHTWEWDCNDIPALTHFTQLFSPPSLWGLPFIAAGYWGCHTGNRGVGKKSWVCVYVCVSVRVRGRGKLCEFLREKVSCKCVRMGKIVCVCVCVLSFSSSISTWGVKLNSPEYKGWRGKGLNLCAWMCVCEGGVWNHAMAQFPAQLSGLKYLKYKAKKKV